MLLIAFHNVNVFYGLDLDLNFFNSLFAVTSCMLKFKLKYFWWNMLLIIKTWKLNLKAFISQLIFLFLLLRFFYLLTKKNARERNTRTSKWERKNFTLWEFFENTSWRTKSMLFSLCCDIPTTLSTETKATKTINVRKKIEQENEWEERRKSFSYNHFDFSCCMCLIRVSIFDWNGTIY